MAKTPLEQEQPTHQRLVLALDAWKYAVSVQMHFNDIEMRVRNLYFTILAASLGLIGVTQGKQLVIAVPPINISLALLVVAAIIPISMLFYFIDRHWYHRLLHGAVRHCIAIEELYKDLLPEIQMGKEISKASPVEFKGIWKWLFFFVRDDKFRKESKLHSDQKIEVLYKSTIWFCVAIFVIYGGFKGIEVNHRTPVQWIIEGICQSQMFKSDEPNSPDDVYLNIP